MDALDDEDLYNKFILPYPNEDRWQNVDNAKYAPWSVMKAFAEAIIKKVREGTKSKSLYLLEIGAGKGRVAIPLADVGEHLVLEEPGRFEQVEAWGIDTYDKGISVEEVQRCLEDFNCGRKQPLRNLWLEKGDIRDLGEFRKLIRCRGFDGFDAITCMFIFHHIKGEDKGEPLWKKAVRELIKSLKPAGGYIILATERSSFVDGLENFLRSDIAACNDNEQRIYDFWIRFWDECYDIIGEDPVQCEATPSDYSRVLEYLVGLGGVEEKLEISDAMSWNFGCNFDWMLKVLDRRAYSFVRKIAEKVDAERGRSFGEIYENMEKWVEDHSLRTRSFPLNFKYQAHFIWFGEPEKTTDRRRDRCVFDQIKGYVDDQINTRFAYLAEYNPDRTPKHNWDNWNGHEREIKKAL